MRSRLKRRLARLPDRAPATGATLLIYHRIGGGAADELDTPTASFAAQLELLAGHDVVSLDTALDRLDAGDDRPTVVLTFDDGFADLHAQAWPLLRERSLPFILFLAAGLVGRSMRWEGGRAKGRADALSWDQLEEMAGSGWCTVGNHTWSHARPEELDERELDRCTEAIESHLGQRPRHFAYTWGIEVPAMRAALRDRFRSVATARLGRNGVDADRLALRRVPVRRTDPIEFFDAKLHGALRAERTYGQLVRVAKRAAPRG